MFRVSRRSSTRHKFAADNVHALLFSIFRVSVFLFDHISMFYQRSNPGETVCRRFDTPYRSIRIVISRNYGSLSFFFSLSPPLPLFLFISRVVRSSSLGLFELQIDSSGQIDNCTRRLVKGIFSPEWIESYS